MPNYENSEGKLIGVSIVPWLPLFGMHLSSSIYAEGKADSIAPLIITAK